MTVLFMFASLDRFTHMTKGCEKETNILRVFRGHERNPCHFKKVLVTDIVFFEWQSNNEVYSRALVKRVIPKLGCVEIEVVYFNMVTSFSTETTYLGSLVTKYHYWPPIILRFWTLRIPCRFLIHFLTCTPMATSTFGELVKWSRTTTQFSINERS